MLDMPTESPPRPNKNTYWVVPLKFLAGEYPGDKDPVKARKKIKQFLAAGVRRFVDLTEGGELVPYDAILSEEAQNSRTKATYQRFPIRDISVPSDPDHLAEIPRSIVASVREGRSTCTVGVAWVALGLWSRAGCESTAKHRATLWPS
jgi:hypothetical protein